MTRGEDLIARRHAVVPPGVGIFAGQTTVESARGAHLIDCDGRQILDFVGGIGVMNAGHCEPSVVAAIQAQAAKLLHTCFHIGTYEPYVALCEKLVELLPHGGPTKAMLLNSGAEAVENAVKIARQATRRSAVLCYTGAFHGRTLLGMTLTAKSKYKSHCGPFAPEVYRLAYPDHFHYGDGLDLETFVDRELFRIREAFVAGPVPPDHVAAVIIEPVLGEGGFVAAPYSYLRGLREICDELGIVLIFDEVQTGFCRVGAWGAFQLAGVVPDVSVWAKSMGGGMPLSSVIGRAEIMDKAAPGTIGGTYGGNPVACAAALATIRVMETQGLCARATVIGAKVRERFEALRDQCTVVGDVRGVGAMMALELCIDGDPRKPATDITTRAVSRCRDNGVLVITAGPFGNVIRILSPLVIDDDDLERGLAVIEQSVLAAATESPS